MLDSELPGTPLPHFLKPRQSSKRSGVHTPPAPIHAVYTHKWPFGQAQVLWWPAATRGWGTTVVPRTVLLFIPGNPGLLDFYVPFLDAIHRGATSHSPGSPESPVTIFAHAHLGLSSYIDGGDGTSAYPETAHVALPAQIQAHLEFLDELLAAHAPTTRVLLVGHSIGAWFVQEMLKARAAALRPRVGAFFLFPTMSHIGLSPNGRMLSPIFRPPWPRVLARLSLLVRHAPLCILGLAQPSWPRDQLRVLRGLLRAPAAIFASLTMANDEMQTVRDLDAGFFREFAGSMWFYYAEEEDGWVGEQRAVVLRALRDTPAESRVVHGRVPHSFCINHSAEVASQCVAWMLTGGFWVIRALPKSSQLFRWECSGPTTWASLSFLLQIGTRVVSGKGRIPAWPWFSIFTLTPFVFVETLHAV
ncbi:hypothetical protein BC826DRAFT_949383 [Russula brevipes]|nr:hypothetical protein BC826DRAFT_949383 [Russula brevipes]